MRLREIIISITLFILPFSSSALVQGGTCPSEADINKSIPKPVRLQNNTIFTVSAQPAVAVTKFERAFIVPFFQKVFCRYFSSMGSQIYELQYQSSCSPNLATRGNWDGAMRCVGTIADCEFNCLRFVP